MTQLGRYRFLKLKLVVLKLIRDSQSQLLFFFRHNLNWGTFSVHIWNVAELEPFVGKLFDGNGATLPLREKHKSFQRLEMKQWCDELNSITSVVKGSNQRWFSVKTLGFYPNRLDPQTYFHIPKSEFLSEVKNIVVFLVSKLTYPLAKFFLEC